MTTKQASLFDLPVLPYGGSAPRQRKDTSKAAADAIVKKLGPLQRKVLLAIHQYSALTDEALDRATGARKPLRPRRRELELAGYVRDSGQRIRSQETGLSQAMWELTPAGVELAEFLVRGGGGEGAPSAVRSSIGADSYQEGERMEQS